MEKANWPRVEEWFGMELFDSIEGIVNVICSNPGPERFINRLYSLHQRLYAKRIEK